MARYDGGMAEGGVFGALLEMQCTVLVPIGQTTAYDLLVDREELGFVRIQCKMGWERNGCILFNSCSTDHGRGRLDYVGRADLFAVYFPPSAEVFIVPVESAATRSSSLRLRPSANNQRTRVRSAWDHELHLWRDALLPPRLLDPVAA